MADKSEMRSAVLKALASNFRGMSRDQIAQHVGQQLDCVIDPNKGLSRTLLPSMRKAGLISIDMRTWHLTDDGRDAIAEVPNEKTQVFPSLFPVCLARVLIIFRF